MKKILFYTTFLTQGGGIEVVTERYMEKLLADGFKVDLYIDYNMGEQNVREKNINKKIKIKYLKPEKISKLIYYFRTQGKKNKIFNIPLYILILVSDYIIWKKEIDNVKKEKYDATITFFQFLPSYLTKVNGPKHFIFLHGSINKFFLGIRKFFKRNYFKKLNKFDYICTVSEEMGKELLELEPSFKDKQITLYNPIDFDEVKIKANDDTNLSEEDKKLLKDKYICSVGRLDESQKDFTTLIKAYYELKKDNLIEEKLYLIGDGPDKDKLQYLVVRLNLEESIIFLGRKDNPYIWMKNSKLFILSSKYEGFPTVLIEALILDIPIVTSNCPTGPKEILENNPLGTLVEVGNIKEFKMSIYKYLQENRKFSTRILLSRFNNKITKFI
ncbi:glycosyltransferase [uncultured Fusobacterium sp.]|uniref:glycosyltransferase n=1 Tax=uncultured Fusobacterium sp. TaxID=159267 RepID=UPI002588C690|nr:glycosyltransferase [uncultured Fusobacterium sp.]